MPQNRLAPFRVVQSPCQIRLVLPVFVCQAFPGLDARNFPPLAGNPIKAMIQTWPVNKLLSSNQKAAALLAWKKGY